MSRFACSFILPPSTSDILSRSLAHSQSMSTVWSVFSRALTLTYRAHRLRSGR